MGTISLRGKVGETKSPYLVLPLTVKPTKRRLCHDARYLNLMMKHSPLNSENIKAVTTKLERQIIRSIMSRLRSTT